MKLLQILETTNSLEKNSFFKILNNLIEKNSTIEIEEILNDKNQQVKDFENDDIIKVFHLLKNDYVTFLKAELNQNISQLDLMIDILIRDGNSILKSRWFESIYKNDFDKLIEKSKSFNELIDEESKDLSEERRRDYIIYRNCLVTAYNNDSLNNIDKKITTDEFTILKTLSNSLGLSNEEIRLINFNTIPTKLIDLEILIKQLRDLGIIIYNKKSDNIFVPEEFIILLREIRGKNIADKYFRRLLNSFENPTLNLICKNHNISIKYDREIKIKLLINQGISLFTLLSIDIFKEGFSIPDKKKELNTLMSNLNIEPKGVTIEDKIQHIIDHFNHIEKDEKIGISLDGFSHLCSDLSDFSSNSEIEINSLIRNEFEFESNVNVLDSKFLIEHNLKPNDILDLMSKELLKSFCTYKSIKTRGDLIENILDSYTDSENIYIENYILLGNRDLNELKLNNIALNTSEIGLKYEEVSKRLLSDLGFNVDEDLKNKINTSKDKIDILVNLGNNDVIIIECKTSKSTQYNKFSSCSRQIKSYHTNATFNGLKVVKTLLIAPDFTQDFVDECEMEIELNLSLITSEVLLNIWKGFKESKHTTFPVNLLMRDALINDGKILKALKVK